MGKNYHVTYRKEDGTWRVKGLEILKRPLLLLLRRKL